MGVIPGHHRIDYDDFEQFDIEVGDSVVHGRTAGAGPPVLLLHGIPETHLMWRAIAPTLTGSHTVVATDLRGYGHSGTPASAPDHAPYSMRSLAEEQVAAMRLLGHRQFTVIGHDRGARCAYRMALDHRSTVTSLVVLDIVPTAAAFARADQRFALGFWVWSFLAAPAPLPESMIAGAPVDIVDHMLSAWSADGGRFADGVRDAYVEQFRDPARVHAICEQYRAAATLDVDHDEADRGSPIACPVLTLWSATGAVADWYDDPVDLWRPWASDVRGHAIAGGHFLPEENPQGVLDALATFLTPHGDVGGLD